MTETMFKIFLATIHRGTEVSPTKNVDSVELFKESEIKNIFPDKVEDIESTEYLGGSSGVRAGYANGEYFVVKKARELESGEEEFGTCGAGLARGVQAARPPGGL